MRPLYLPSTPPRSMQRFAGSEQTLYQFTFIVVTALLLGLGYAAASAWSWLAELQSQTSR